MTKKQSKSKGKEKLPAAGSIFSRNLLSLIIFCFGFLLYANTISHGYNLDDELVTRNHKLTSQGIKAIPLIFTSHYYSDNMGYAYEYRPIVHVSFAIEHQFLGENPHWSHFINTSLYACMCLLLLILLKTLFGNENSLFCFLATLLFTAHPVHTEVVASIKNRDEILALIFSMAAWLVISRYAQKNFWLGILLAGGLFFLALLSKITVLAFAIIIPVSLHFFNNLSVPRVFITSVALFFPVSFFINLTPNELGLLSLLTFVSLYSIYVTDLLFRYIKTGGSGSFSLKQKGEFFLMKYVFPFNLKFFRQFIYYLVIPLLYLSSIFILIDTSKYGFFLAISGALFLFSIRSEGNLKWILLLVFQLSLWVMFYLISPKFVYVIFLLWTYLSFLYVKNESIKEKIILSGLLVISLPLAVLNAEKFYEFELSLLFFIITLTPYFKKFLYKTGKAGVYLLAFLLLDNVITACLDLTSGNALQTSYIVKTVVLLYVLLAFYPRKLSIKHSWVFAVVGVTYCLFCFLVTPENELNLWRAKEVQLLVLDDILPKSYPFSETDKVQPSDPAENRDEKFADGQRSLLENVIGKTTDRPLDFVENPIRYDSPLQVKIASAFDIGFRYFKLLIVPHPLSFYYGYKEIHEVNFTDPKVIGGILLYSLLFIFGLYCLWQRKFIPLLGTVIYLVSIASFSNIFRAVPGMMADRYLLIPSIGFCILLVYVMFRFLKVTNYLHFSQLPAPVRYVFIFFLVIYSTLTVSRNADWIDDNTIFSNDIKHVEQSAQAHHLLALNLRAKAAELKGNQEEKSKLVEQSNFHFKKALDIYPQFFNVSYSLGLIYSSMNQPDSALKYFGQASEADTNFMEVHLKMGEILFNKREYPEAAAHWQKVIDKRPLDYRGYDKLSYLYFILGNYERAIELNRLAIEKIPERPEPVVNLGRTYLGIKQIDSARFYFEKALQIDSGNMLVKQLLKQTKGE